MQMGVAKIKTASFVVCTIHGMVIGKINFDKELWESMKSNFERLLFKLIFLRVRG